MLRQRLRYLNSYLKNNLNEDKTIYVLEHDNEDDSNETDQYQGK